MSTRRETPPPPIQRDVAARLASIVRAGGFDMPDPVENPGFGGNGGPGMWLESLLGVNGGNRDLPDSGAWEIKTHSGVSLLTLFHQEHVSGVPIREFIDRWGIETGRGRAFRHTVRATAWSSGPRIKGFRAFPDWTVRHLVRADDDPEVVAEWNVDDITSHLSGKLRRMIYMRVSRPDERRVVCHGVTLWWRPRVTALTDMLRNGVMQIDFDASLRNDGTFKNHGTKFRIRSDALGVLYSRSGLLGSESGADGAGGLLVPERKARQMHLCL